MPASRLLSRPNCQQLSAVSFNLYLAWRASVMLWYWTGVACWCDVMVLDWCGVLPGPSASDVTTTNLFIIIIIVLLHSGLNRVSDAVCLNLNIAGL